MLPTQNKRPPVLGPVNQRSAVRACRKVGQWSPLPRYGQILLPGKNTGLKMLKK